MEEILIRCGACKSEARVALTLANLGIRRCPRCSAPVQPIRVSAAPSAAATAEPDEPEMTLAPLPDDAYDVVDEPKESPIIDFGTDHLALAPLPAPAPPPSPPRPPPPADLAPIPLRDVPPPAPGGIPFRTEQDAGSPAVKPIAREAKRELFEELRPKPKRREKTLAGRPLWAAVYSFPVRPDNARIIILLVICLTLMALIGSALRAVWTMMHSIHPDAEISGFATLVTHGAAYVFTSLFVLLLFITLTPAATFMRVIEETSAGIDEVRWPRDPWFEFVGKWLFLAWLTGIGAGAGALVLSPIAWLLPRAVYLCGVLALTWLAFPIVLLSTTAAASAWVLINPLLLARLVKRRAALRFLYANAVAFLVPCLLLGYGLTGGYYWFLAPVVGVGWTYLLLCYGRVLGRVGFEMSREE